MNSGSIPEGIKRESIA